MEKTDIEKYSEQLAEIFPDLTEDERLKVLDKVYKIRRINTIKEDLTELKSDLIKVDERLSKIIKTELSGLVKDSSEKVINGVKRIHAKIRNSNT